jgi:hypothetical protein
MTYNLKQTARIAFKIVAKYEASDIGIWAMKKSLVEHAKRVPTYFNVPVIILSAMGARLTS